MISTMPIFREFGNKNLFDGCLNERIKMSSPEKEKELEALNKIDEFNQKQKAHRDERNRNIQTILNNLVHLSDNAIVRVLVMTKTLKSDNG